MFDSRHRLHALLGCTEHRNGHGAVQQHRILELQKVQKGRILSFLEHPAVVVPIIARSREPDGEKDEAIDVVY